MPFASVIQPVSGLLISDAGPGSLILGEVLWAGWEGVCSNPDSLGCLQTVWEAGG